MISPHSDAEAVSDAALNEMLAGLEGVTPGSWFVHTRLDEAKGTLIMSATPGLDHTIIADFCQGYSDTNDQDHATAAHIARCDPDTIRYLVTQELSRRAANTTGGVGQDSGVTELFLDAWAEAEKAMRKFPQPNYVISKVAEEAGEVVKAAIHCAEGRDTPGHVAEEIRQAMAMLIRLYIEGDQVHGLAPILSALSTERK